MTNSRIEQSKTDSFNENFPVGHPVWVTNDDGSREETITTSTAWVMGGHTAMIKVKSKSGAYMLDRVSPKAAS